jgi:TolB-like protein
MVVCLIAAFLWQSKYRTGGTGGTAVNSIAVLPLQNLNDDFSVDYLRFALADEIANTLASSRTLDVRSSAVTRKYVGADLDPQQIGRDLHVTTLLTGHFQKQETHLMVTVEAIETGTGRAGVASQSYGFDSRVDRLGGAACQGGPTGFDAHAGRGRRRPRGLEVL